MSRWSADAQESKKRASDHEGLKFGVSQNCTTHFFGFEVTCPWAQNGGCKKHRLHVCPSGVCCPQLRPILGWNKTELVL